jgi:hypothetical protein
MSRLASPRTSPIRIEISASSSNGGVQEPSETHVGAGQLGLWYRWFRLNHLDWYQQQWGNLGIQFAARRDHRKHLWRQLVDHNLIACRIGCRHWDTGSHAEQCDNEHKWQLRRQDLLLTSIGQGAREAGATVRSATRDAELMSKSIPPSTALGEHQACRGTHSSVYSEGSASAGGADRQAGGTAARADLDLRADGTRLFTYRLRVPSSCCPVSAHSGAQFRRLGRDGERRLFQLIGGRLDG